MKKLIIPCLALLAVGCSPHQQNYQAPSARMALNNVGKSLEEYQQEVQNRVNSLCKAGKFASTDQPESIDNFGMECTINSSDPDVATMEDDVEVELETGNLYISRCPNKPTKLFYLNKNQMEVEVHIVESQNFEALQAVLDSSSKTLEDYIALAKLQNLGKRIPFVARHTYTVENEDQAPLKAKADKLFKDQKAWGDISFNFGGRCPSEGASNTAELHGYSTVQVDFGKTYDDSEGRIFMAQTVSDFLSTNLDKVEFLEMSDDEDILSSDQIKLTAKQLNPFSLTFAITVEEGQINLTIDQLNLSWLKGIPSGPQTIDNIVGGSNEVPRHPETPLERHQREVREGVEARKAYYKREIESRQ